MYSEYFGLLGSNQVSLGQVVFQDPVDNLLLASVVLSMLTVLMGKMRCILEESCDHMLVFPIGRYWQRGGATVTPRMMDAVYSREDVLVTVGVCLGRIDLHVGEDSAVLAGTAPYLIRERTH